MAATWPRSCAAIGATGALRSHAPQTGSWGHDAPQPPALLMLQLTQQTPSHEDAEQMPARFAAFRRVCSWLGISAEHAGDTCCNKQTMRQTLAGLTATVVAQSLMTEAVSLVQRSATFKNSLPHLKALVAHRFARASTRDPFSRQLVLDSLLTILILRSLSPDLLKRPKTPRQLLLPLWHLPRAGAGREKRGGLGGSQDWQGWRLVEGGRENCERIMPLRVGSIGTVASVLVLGELVECAVKTGRVNCARDLLALLLSRIVRHPLGLPMGLPHVVQAVEVFHAQTRLDVEHLLAIEEDVLPALLKVRRERYGWDGDAAGEHHVSEDKGEFLRKRKRCGCRSDQERDRRDHYKQGLKIIREEAKVAIVAGVPVCVLCVVLSSVCLSACLHVCLSAARRHFNATILAGRRGPFYGADERVLFRVGADSSSRQQGDVSPMGNARDIGTVPQPQTGLMRLEAEGGPGFSCKTTWARGGAAGVEDGGESKEIASGEARHRDASGAPRRDTTGAFAGSNSKVGHDTGSMRESQRECVTKLDMCIADCKLFLLLSSSAMECSPSPPPRVP